MDLLGFFQPKTIEEARSLLFKHKNSKLLAGGTDLVLELCREKIEPDYLIDISRIQELKNITEDEKYIKLGSMVTFTNVQENKLLMKNYNSLIECAKNMGSPQIRNVATIGGNVANGGSAADITPCIISLGGILVIESVDNVRQISCENYFKNFSEEKLKENEILTSIILPKKNEKSGYYKLGKRNSLAIARVSCAVSLRIEENIIKSIGLSLGAVGRYPIRVIEFEAFALGKQVDCLFGEEALGIIENAVYKSIKGRKTMPFKKVAVKGVYKSALRIALACE